MENRHHNHVHSLQSSQLAIDTLQCNRNGLASFHTNSVVTKTDYCCCWERSKSFVFSSFNVKQTWEKFHCSLPLWSIQLLSVTCSFSFLLCFGVFVREQQNKSNLTKKNEWINEWTYHFLPLIESDCLFSFQFCRPNSNRNIHGISFTRKFLLLHILRICLAFLPPQNGSFQIS